MRAWALRLAGVTFFHLAFDALLADALRSSDVNTLARALPPRLASQWMYSAADADFEGRGTERL